MVEPGVEGGITQTYISREGQQVTLVEGEIIEENGRRYQVVANGVGHPVPQGHHRPGRASEPDSADDPAADVRS
jgi:hypothetical protein